MKITLDSNPSDAPCCIKIIAEDGRDVLVQTDWDWPGIATSFGFSLHSVQKCDECKLVTNGHYNDVVKYCGECKRNVGNVCHHERTDGTVNCPDCGCTASEFIQAAREWIDDNDGAEVEDPGYFDND